MEKYIKFGNKGKVFEENVELMNDIYEKRGLGKVQFIPTPQKYAKNKEGEKIHFFDKKSTIDFLGCLDYRTIAFDAKQCSEDRWNIKKNFKPHQEKALVGFRKGGATSFILVYMKKYNEVYVLSLIDIQKFVALGLKSVSIEDLRANPLVFVGRGDQLPDYRKVLQRFAGRNL